MKKINNLRTLVTLATISCNKKEETPTTLTENQITLQFQNVVGNQELKLGDVNTATSYTTNGQIIKFSEVKYVITNIILVKSDGTEVPYHTEDLDKGGFVIDQAKTASLTPVLQGIPAGEYKQIKFGLGVKKELNDLKLQEKFPNFYTTTGYFDDNKGQMHWEWSGGYRFVKIEGWHSTENKVVSIHIGSAYKANPNTPDDTENTVLNDARDGFRFITLDLPTNVVVGTNAPKITINADFDKLANGTNKITFKDGDKGNVSATVHHLNHMFFYVNNLGGNQDINGQQIIVKDINDDTQPQAGIDN
ncbi:MAG: hypothetical protein Q4C98_11280, partial [Capnocytophaga sp.]|nr:hypothetical protein [Capnocytophaga sp.]